MQPKQSFDVFLSYKSEDENWVQTLKHSLQRRGVKVWLDRDQIRPGDLFARALENGLASSRAVALIITPESVASNWVQDEYYRALSLANQGNLQLIPLLLREAELPGFLSGRQHIDFRDPQKFDQNVDRLIWPGITGKQVVFVPVYGRYHSKRWQRLADLGSQEGLRFIGGEDIDRVRLQINSQLNDPSKRVVLVMDIFEERPHETKIWRNTTSEYISFIFEYRERTKGKDNEVIFLLYQQPNAWGEVPIPETNQNHPYSLHPDSLKTKVIDRLKHYFILHQDIKTDRAFRAALRKVWHRIQNELLIAESR